MLVVANKICTFGTRTSHEDYFSVCLTGSLVGFSVRSRVCPNWY